MNGGRTLKDGGVEDRRLEDGRVKDGRVEDGRVKDGWLEDGRVEAAVSVVSLFPSLCLILAASPPFLSSLLVIGHLLSPCKKNPSNSCPASAHSYTHTDTHIPFSQQQ